MNNTDCQGCRGRIFLNKPHIYTDRGYFCYYPCLERWEKRWLSSATIISHIPFGLGDYDPPAHRLSASVTGIFTDKLPCTVPEPSCSCPMYVGAWGINHSKTCAWVKWNAARKAEEKIIAVDIETPSFTGVFTDSLPWKT